MKLSTRLILKIERLHNNITTMVSLPWFLSLVTFYLLLPPLGAVRANFFVRTIAHFCAFPRLNRNPCVRSCSSHFSLLKGLFAKCAYDRTIMQKAHPQTARSSASKSSGNDHGTPIAGLFSQSMLIHYEISTTYLLEDIYDDISAARWHFDFCRDGDNIIASRFIEI